MSEIIWTSENDNIDTAETLVDIIKKHIKTSSVLIDAKNVDWKHSNGYKIVDIGDRSVRDIYNDIYPSYDCMFELVEDNGILKAIVYSHDVPSGSIWTFKEYDEPEDDYEGDIEK